MREGGRGRRGEGEGEEGGKGGRGGGKITGIVPLVCYIFATVKRFIVLYL